jgi:hypothetical protein
VSAQGAIYHLAIGAVLAVGFWCGLRPIIRTLAYDAAAVAILESIAGPNTPGEDR